MIFPIFYTFKFNWNKITQKKKRLFDWRQRAGSCSRVLSLCSSRPEEPVAPSQVLGAFFYLCFMITLSTRKCSLHCLFPEFFHHPSKFRHSFLCKIFPDISPLSSSRTGYILPSGAVALKVWRHRQYTCLLIVYSNTRK